MQTKTGALLAGLCVAMLFAVAGSASAGPAPEGGAAAAAAEAASEAKPEAGNAEVDEPDGDAPDTGDKAEAPEKGESASAASEGGESSGPARLKDLVGDGFVIRTTVFIPADAVTRQLGKVSSDAMVLTLQKSTSTAVCYYTFKAYVAEGLTTIPSCIVHR